jgi:hypothetical protein
MRSNRRGWNGAVWMLAMLGLVACAGGSGETGADAAFDASSEAASDGSLETGPADGADSTDAELPPEGVAVGWCTYTNPFSQLQECLAYTGAGWSRAEAEADCATVFPETVGAFSADTRCTFAEVLGRCFTGGVDGRSRVVLTEGTEADACRVAGVGCAMFFRGTFTPEAPCAVPVKPSTGGFGQPFVQPYPVCRVPADDEPAGHGADGKVCAWTLISGCTEEGRRFDEDASCADVLTQRPYYASPNEPQTAADDPRLADTAYMAEVDWARRQVEACGCVCCHSTRASAEGPSQWYVEAGPIWLDSIADTGLSMLAGYSDSSALGAFPSAENNGFDRTALGLPTTDIDRMRTLLQGEYARRGFTPEQGAAVPPFGGPIYAQLVYEPEACTASQGLDSEGRLVWTGGKARHLYVLEAGSGNPGVPPNFDEPEGTRWRLEVPFFGEPFASGVPYGVTPTEAVQRFPQEGGPAALQSGQTYYLVALRDVGFPLARCLFTAP